MAIFDITCLEKSTWLALMAHTMSYIYRRRIIIADIRLDNLLLTDDLCVKFSDFGESKMMPLDWDLNGSDDLGFSIMTDIGQFGAVMFEIVTGQRCRFNLALGRREPGALYTWPPRDSLPSTANTRKDKQVTTKLDNAQSPETIGFF